MEFNFKKSFGKRLVAFFLTFSIILSTFYLPIFAPRTQAVLGFGDIVIDIKQFVEKISDAIAMTLAQRMIDDIVKSTVKWAQSGFEGNPAYVTNPEQYFSDIADGVIGQYVENNGKLRFLCSPFQTQVRLALQKQYVEPTQFQCTLTDVVANIDAFYNDFDQGGWDAWFSMTQNDVNNPYGAYLLARTELDSQIASAVGLKREQLNINQGFLSWSECEKKNPAAYIEEYPGSENWYQNPEHVSGVAEGECIERGPIQTPGSTIKSQLDRVLPSGLEKLVSAQHINQLVSAFASGLLNRYVFGSQGLFAKSNNSRAGATNSSGSNNRTGAIDLDNDGIPDGRDGDRDGKLESNVDICYHGGRPDPDTGCSLSGRVTSSPYFAPICESIDGTVITLTEYSKFIDSHADQIEGGSSLAGTIITGVLQGGPGALVFRSFGIGGSADNFKNKADADIWANRTSEVNSTIDELLSSIQSRRSSYFDDIEIATNRFSNYIDKVMESLSKDKDLDLARIGSGGGGLENVMKSITNSLKYFKEVKTKIGRCDNPNLAAIQNIELPPDVPQPTTGELEENGICASPEDVETFLENNPGDAGRLPEVFPCNNNSEDNSGNATTTSSTQ